MELEEALHLLEDTPEFNKYIAGNITIPDMVKSEYTQKTGRPIITDIYTYIAYKNAYQISNGMLNYFNLKFNKINNINNS